MNETRSKSGAPFESSVMHLHRTGWWPRLHEFDKPLSLKEVADNLKNYGIWAAMFALARRMFESPDVWDQIASGGIFLMTTVFGLAIFFQTVVLANKAMSDIAPFTAADYYQTGWKARLRGVAKLALYMTPALVAAFLAFRAGSWLAHGLLAELVTGHH